ncbi:MAG: bifunctional homocysteine S-methyltransferase/methylenetetrahydrofolate reductase [Lachnospira sp.]
MVHSATENELDKYLEKKKIITDGAFGTYFSYLYDTEELPEKSNITAPERIVNIHKQYIKAGAKLIRTNTFASNTESLKCSLEEVRENIRAAVNNAKRAAGEDTFIAGDIGPVPTDNLFDRDSLAKEYLEICRVFLEEGLDIIIFETFSELTDIIPAIEFVGERAFIITQFSVNQFGYSNAGLSAKKLVAQAQEVKQINAVGFNCGIGPGHMQRIISQVKGHTDKYISAIANAGYPQSISQRMTFSNTNTDYFASKVSDIAADGVDIVGGCCGTTPEYIQKLSERVDLFQKNKKIQLMACEAESVKCKDVAFYREKADSDDKRTKKLIAVELAPPIDCNDERLMDAAHLLEKTGVDVLTFPDSPSGRTRADSILMAEKVSRETGICVMPHICCRDKNAIAMRSQLLGAYINNINNFLVITGDPIPSLVRSKVKSVFNFDSVGLMNIINDMNEDQFAGCPVVYGGAINQGRANFDVEISRVKKKIEAGASFFFSQPVFSKQDEDRLRRIKNETGARILCGIMPLVSLKNALFMKNEMTGIDVTDEVISMYSDDLSKEEGEETGIRLARKVISETLDFADGYYFSFPFNRVYMLNPIIQGLLD